MTQSQAFWKTPPSLLMPLLEPHTSLYVDIIHISINEINSELLIWIIKTTLKPLVLNNKEERSISTHETLPEFSCRFGHLRLGGWGFRVFIVWVGYRTIHGNRLGTKHWGNSFQCAHQDCGKPLFGRGNTQYFYKWKSIFFPIILTVLLDIS